MKLNPLHKLSDLFSKLVVEHGSAIITEKHLALFKDQLTLAEKEIKKLTSALEDCQAENNKLREIVQKHQKPNDDSTLNETAVNILILLSKHDDRSQVRAEHIAESLNVGLQAATFYLNDLAGRNMVLKNRMLGSDITGGTSYSYWTLKQEGRRYLVENKLIF